MEIEMSNATNETDSRIEVSQSTESELQYQVKGKTFIVQPVFRAGALETIGSVLLRLMKAELAHPQT